MINLAEQIEALNSIHMKWTVIKKDGVVDETNVKLFNSIGFPSYSSMQDIDDYENIAIIIDKQKSGFQDVTAVLYGDKFYRLDIYDQEDILGVYLDDRTRYFRLSADTFEKAEAEAETYIIEGISIMLECAQEMANRYLQEAV